MADQNELVVALRLVAEQFQGELKKTESSLASFAGVSKAEFAKVSLAVTAVVGSLVAITKSAADYGDQLFKTSQKIGMSVEALGALEFAAKLSDLSNQGLIIGLKKLSIQASEAAHGSGEAAEAFTRMGISVTQGVGQLRPTEQLLLDIAERFHMMPSDVDRTALAVKLFGRNGIEMIPFLEKGREGITALMEEARKLGLVLTTEQAKAAEEFNDNLKRIEASAKGLTVIIGNDLVKAFEKLAGVLAQGAQGDTSPLKAFWFLLRSIGIDVHNVIAQLTALKDFDLKTPQGRAAAKAFNEEIQRIVEEEKIKLAATLAGIPLPSEGPAPGRPGTTLGAPTGNPEKEKTLEAQRKAQETALKSRLEAITNNLALEEATIQLSLTTREIDETTATNRTLDAKRRALEAELAAYRQQQSQLEVFAGKRIILGFKDAELQKTFQEEILTKKIEVAGKITALEAQRGKVAVETDIAIAKQTDLKEQRLGEALVKNVQGTHAATAEELQIVLLKQQEEERILLAGKTTEFDLILQRLEVLKAANAVEVQDAQLTGKDVLTIERRQFAERGALIRALSDEVLAQSIRAEADRIKALELGFADEKVIGAARLHLLQLQQDRENSLFKGTPEEKFAQTARQQAETADVQRQFFGGFFENYTAELQKFVRDTNSVFGLARQMAISTAQAMTQGFQTFFFNVFTGQVQSMKDVLKGVLNFALQVLSQVMASMATVGLLKGAVSLFPSLGPILSPSPSASVNFFGGGTSGLNVGPTDLKTVLFAPAHAAGGVFSTPHLGLVAEKGPEAIAPLGDLLEAIRAKGAGAGDVHITVQINAGGTTTQKGGGAMPNLQQLARSIGKMLEDKIIDEQRPGGLLAPGAAA